MQRLFYLIAAIVASCGILFTSCEKISGMSTPSPIKISVAKVNDTKSYAITNDNFRSSEGFTIEAYVGEYYKDPQNKSDEYNPWEHGDQKYFTDNAQFIAGQWVLDNNQVWIKNAPTTFWCYAPINLRGTLSLNLPGVINGGDQGSPNATTRKFSYSMPTPNGSSDADNADDLILAYKEQTYNGLNETVDLTFYHSLSQIEFCVSPDDGKYDKKLKIISIGLKQIPSVGDCKMDGPATEDRFTWSNQATLVNVNQIYNATFYSAPDGWERGYYTADGHRYTLYSSLNNFFIIPHQMDGAGENGTQIEIVFDDNGQQYTVRKPLDDLIKPGFYYKYKIDATVIGRTIDLGVSLVDWQEYDDKIFIEEN